MNKIKRIIAALLSAAIISMPTAALAQYNSFSEMAAATDNKASESDAPQPFEGSGNYKALLQISEYIGELYVDETITSDIAIQKGLSAYLDENNKALWDMLKAMFRSLDPWCDFYTKSEYKEYQDGINRTFYGIGVAIIENEGYVEISGFSEEGGLAQRTGFRVGDKIVKVAGVDCVGMSTNSVRNLIVGELGTKVTVTVLRDGQYIDIEATRTEVKQATATTAILKGDIGYLRIASFGVDTAAEVAEGLDFFKENGIDKFILDLRNNGGGLLDAAIEIAQMLIPKGKIIDVVYRDSANNTSYYANGTTEKFELVTLVNENSASASEVLASAIRDSGAGKLVGETTFGKAVVQQAFPLQNGMYFKLTVGEYITRNGNSINLVGLEPDEFVKNTTQAIDSTQYTVFDFKTRAALGDYTKNALAAKEKLSLLGFYNGKAEDMSYNAELKDAVKEFQKENRLAASGVLDVATQVKLEDEFEKLKTVVDRQLYTAYEMLGGDPAVFEQE